MSEETLKNIKDILDQFLKWRGITVYEQAGRWTFTNVERTYETAPDAYEAALEHLEEIVREYERVYADWLLR